MPISANVVRPAHALLAAFSLAIVIGVAGDTAIAQDRTAASPVRATPVNPYDTEVRGLIQEAVSQANRDRGILPVLEIYRTLDRATPGVVADAISGLASDRRLPARTRAYATYLLARIEISRGHAERAEALINELGFVRNWRVIGSFDNEGKNGFDRATPIEEARTGPVDMDARYPGRERPVSWREYPAVSRTGYVNFDAVFRPFNNVCGYAETYVHTDRARVVTAWAGAGGAFRFWVNGATIAADEAYRGLADPDRTAAPVALNAGWNRILVKDCISDGAWGFFFRLANLDGSPATGLRYDSMANVTGAESYDARAAQAARGSATAAFQGLLRASSEENPPAGALADFATMLSATGADDAAERLAKQLGARVADLEPTVEHLRLAAQLADERAEVMRFANRALEVAPNDPEAMALAALSASRGPDPNDALPLIARIPRGTRAWVDGAILHAQILHGLGMHEAGRALVDEALVLTHRAPAFLAEAAQSAARCSRRDLSMALREEILRNRFDDGVTRTTLATDALRRGDSNAVVQHVEAIHALHPDSSQTLFTVAQFYDALGRDEDVLAVYREALALAPEDANAHVAMGRELLRLDQRDAAADAFRLALTLRPQDADTRELLEQLRPEARQDEAYAATSEEILSRRTANTDYPVTVLQHLVVNTVYDNGLGSSFNQIAAQVNDAEGARRFRTYSIQFDPESQRVDLRLARVTRRSGQVLEANQNFLQQLGEPWYRIYYNTLAQIVVFPDLEPGDVVELRYRIDDISHRNVFADYYGDLQFLQSGDPQKRMEYVLIAPSSRAFHFNEPQLPGLQRTQTTNEGKTIVRYVATDVPAIRSEDGMPGLTEIAPYLHVSTYATWQEVGHWWWGLVHDQLYADDSLRRTVANLVRGAPDTRTKVQRIYDWVVTNTRYVGLEFGIHGYLPYRVPQIVQRGFGDCKDKASLLYTMMREAGIDARIALVRTRRNGSINDLPASLAVFDHAIAYVPEFDLYLDGTAEYNGTTELPTQDQGVTVLVVGPESAELRRTPVLEANLSHRDRTLAVRLAADGSAEITGTEEVRGADAPSLRATYLAEGTREDRMERWLSNLFPGADLQEQSFTNLEQREMPVRLHYRARVAQFAQRDGTTMRVAPTVMNELVRNLARTPERRYPLDLGGLTSYSETRTIELAGNLQVSTLPDGGNATSDFGSLRMSVSRTGRTVAVTVEFAILRDRISPAEYPAFKRWVEQADVLLRQRIVLTGGAQ